MAVKSNTKFVICPKRIVPLRPSFYCSIYQKYVETCGSRGNLCFLGWGWLAGTTL